MTASQKLSVVLPLAITIPVVIALVVAAQAQPIRPGQFIVEVSCTSAGIGAPYCEPSAIQAWAVSRSGGVPVFLASSGGGRCGRGESGMVVQWPGMAREVFVGPFDRAAAADAWVRGIPKEPPFYILNPCGVAQVLSITAPKEIIGGTRTISGRVEDAEFGNRIGSVTLRTDLGQQLHLTAPARDPFIVTIGDCVSVTYREIGTQESGGLTSTRFEAADLTRLPAQNCRAGTPSVALGRSTTQPGVSDAPPAQASAHIRQLMGQLEDPNPDVRSNAALTLAKMGPGAREAVPALIYSLEKVSIGPLANYEASASAAYALGQIGPGSAQAIPSLCRVVNTYYEGRINDLTNKFISR